MLSKQEHEKLFCMYQIHWKMEIPYCLIIQGASPSELFIYFKAKKKD